MDRKLLLLVAVIGIFGVGSATALLVPVGFSTTDNVKLYTKTTSIEVESSPTTTFQDFCDLGDTIINGYIIDISEPITDFNLISAVAVVNPSGAEGYQVKVNNGGVTQMAEGTIVCAKVIPLSVVGGMFLQPDTTALILAYGIVNAVWIAPTLAGIGIGIYLTKSKWKNSENS